MVLLEKLKERRKVKRAMNELRGFTDRELAELGITRQSIREAVLNGRPTIEGVEQERSRAA